MIRLWTSKIHIYFIYSYFYMILVFLKRNSSIFSYATSFSSIGCVVCEIHPIYWTYVCCKAWIQVVILKYHISFIWTPFSFILVSTWWIRSLISYETSFTLIRYVVWEIHAASNSVWLCLHCELVSKNNQTDWQREFNIFQSWGLI